MGLTSAVMLAPAALHVALREFRTWYEDIYADMGAESSAQSGMANHSNSLPCRETSAYFPYFRTEFDTTISALQQDWSISASEEYTWPQHIITTRMKEKNKEILVSSLDTDNAYRLAQVSQNTCLTRSSTSDIQPALSHDSNFLRHCPMGHFSLTCPFELSNAAIHTSTALLLGYPVPHARYLQTRPGHPSSRPVGRYAH